MTLDPFEVVCGTDYIAEPFQQVSGVGTAGQPLVSNGEGALPEWKEAIWTRVSGTPTTLIDYGITEAVRNNGLTPKVAAGHEVHRPAAGIAGQLYVTTDTKMWYRDNGTAWEHIGGYVFSIPVDISHGGTGQDEKEAAFDALSPMTYEGDMIYADAGCNGVVLAGNVENRRKLLLSTGDGSDANAPAWDVLDEEDIDGILIDAGIWL